MGSDLVEFGSHELAEYFEGDAPALIGNGKKRLVDSLEENEEAKYMRRNKVDRLGNPLAVNMAAGLSSSQYHDTLAEGYADLQQNDNDGITPEFNLDQLFN